MIAILPISIFAVLVLAVFNWLESGTPSSSRPSHV
jgi:hypothetical protein